MPTLADQIAPKPQQPSGLGGWLASIGDEMAGAFARYGRRSGAQRDASLELLNQASAPGTDPIMGAGQKLLGLAGLITHPLAFFPTREEWDQRLQAAGNDSRIGRSIGGFLSDLPSLIDPQMAAGGAATVAPAIFAGMMAKTADLKKFQAADKLEALGHTASDIRDMTGLHKGPDGKWRNEISDANASLRFPAGDPRATNINTMVDHPEFLKAYPRLGYTEVSYTGPQPGGRYIPKESSETGRARIEYGGATPEDQKSVILHELQHAVASVEGFDPGAAYSKGGDAAEWDRYFRNAGETEARNVQTRMNMSAQDLADETNAPWLTQDVPYSQQILSGGGGVSQSAPSTVSRDKALQGLVDQPQRRQLTTQSYKETLPDGTERWVPGTLRSNPTTAPRFEPSMSIADIRRYIEQFGEPPPPRAKGEIVTGKRKDVYPDGTVTPVPGLLRTKRPPSLGEALQGLVGGDDAPLAAKMLNKADDVADLGKVAAVSDDLVSDYQIPDTWYHGSPADIYGPDGTGKFRLTAGETGVPALWASNDPFTAEGYSRGEIALQYDDAAGRFPLTRSWYSDRDASGGVYGLKSQAKNPLIHDAGGEKWINVKQGKIMREALAAGHDAVVFRNIADNYQNGGPTSDVIAFLDLGAMKPDRK